MLGELGQLRLHSKGILGARVGRAQGDICVGASYQCLSLGLFGFLLLSIVFYRGIDWYASRMVVEALWRSCCLCSCGAIACVIHGGVEGCDLNFVDLLVEEGIV